MKLSEAEWFTKIYRKIYDVLNAESMLPPPDQITILRPADVKVRDTVHGLCWKEEKMIWFREQPPPPLFFAHELLHLIDKDIKLEEVYAYNLSSLAVILAKKDIVPKKNIIRLFDVNEEQLLQAIRKAYNYNFKSLEDYFAFIGVIPHVFEFEFSDGQYRLKRSKYYDEKAVVIATITELIAAAEFGDMVALNAILNLLI